MILSQHGHPGIAFRNLARVHDLSPYLPSARVINDSFSRPRPGLMVGLVRRRRRRESVATRIFGFSPHTSPLSRRRNFIPPRVTSPHLAPPPSLPSRKSDTSNRLIFLRARPHGYFSRALWTAIARDPIVMPRYYATLALPLDIRKPRAFGRGTPELKIAAVRPSFSH